MRKIPDYVRATSAAAAASAASATAVAAAAAAAACAQRQSCEGYQSTLCAWGVLCGMYVARSHAQEPRARSLFSLTSRVGSKAKQHPDHPREHAALVHKTYGGVIDVASAPRQDTAA